MFGDIEIEKKNLPHETPVLFKDGYIEKVLDSKKKLFGEKILRYFICYLYDDNKVKPLHIMLPKTSTYV